MITASVVMTRAVSVVPVLYAETAVGVLTLHAIITHASAAINLRAAPPDAPAISVRSVMGAAKMDVLEDHVSAA